MPTLGFHISEDSELLKRIKARADAEYNGKVSSYARAVVERDLNGETGPVHSKSILVDLTRKLLGEPAAENMEILCPPPLNQAHELRRLLEDYIADKERRFLTAEEKAEYSKGNKDVVLEPLYYQRIKPREDILYPQKKQVRKKKA